MNKKMEFDIILPLSMKAVKNNSWIKKNIKLPIVEEDKTNQEIKEIIFKNIGFTFYINEEMIKKIRELSKEY